MKLADKLRVVWSKRERDLMIHFPLGYGTKSDGHVMAGIFSEDVTRDLDERGYDVTTLKFSIEPKKGEQRFASQRSNHE